MFEEYQEAAHKAEQRKKMINIMVLISGILLSSVFIITQYLN